ncbi:MAG: cell wall hydrolase [Anaerocolumna sp.]
MLNIHSFLQRVKEPIHKVLPSDIHKYKTSMVVIAYTMITVLFLLSPDYIYGTGNNGVESYAKAETTHNVPEEIAEETANEAIVRTNQNNLESQFILFDLTAKGTLPELQGHPDQNLFPEGKSYNDLVVSTGEDDSNNQKTVNNTTANSNQAGADAKLKVDSSSTREGNKTKTVMAVTVTAKDTKETESKDSKDSDKDSKDSTKNSKASESKDTKESDKDKEKKYVIDLSENEIEILQRIVEAEATGEDIKGKILVANVILNRVGDDDFPNTIKGVVFQKDGSTYQFSPIKDNRYWSVKISKDAKKAVERVMQGEDYSKGALYFSARLRADKSSMRWFDNHLDFLFQYGGHEFFK